MYIQSVQAYLSPPICVAYFAGVLHHTTGGTTMPIIKSFRLSRYAAATGVLWPRASSRGAVLTLGVGYSLGFSRLVLEIVLKDWCDNPQSFYCARALKP